MKPPAGTGSAGVWRRRDTLATHTSSQVTEQLERGRWIRLFRASYLEATGAITTEQRELAAVLATCPRDKPAELDGHPTAAACLRSAARVWGFPLINDDDPSTEAQEHLLHDVTTERNLAARAKPSSDEHVIHRYRLTISADELVRLSCGLWLTNPLRTALDCAAHLDFEAAVCLLDHGLREGLLTMPLLAAGVASRRGKPGVRAAKEAVAAADGRSESPAETLARLLLLPHLPGLVPQQRIYDERGVIVARVDLADTAAKLAIEIDGKRWHSGERMVAKDRARDRRLEALGWTTERVTWHELRTSPASVVARILDRRQQLLSRVA